MHFLCVSTMRLNSCLTVLHVFMLAALLVTSGADSEESSCSIEVSAQRDTVYEVSLGKELWINCTVQFCNDSPPEVFWYKLEKTAVPVNVSRGSHIRQQWRESSHLQGISYLIFQNILLSDSGSYQCTSDDIVSHNINVSVSGEESSCFIEVLVQRDTVYEVSLGEELWINCTVQFCTDSPPQVFWYKIEKTPVPVNVSRGSHIRQEWRESSHLEGISYLIFQNILMSDSGVYQCTSDDIVSHSINVSVSESSKTPNPLWPFVYRVVGVVVFAIIVIFMCVTPCRGKEGVCCAGRSSNTPDPSRRLSPEGLTNVHVYENDQ